MHLRCDFVWVGGIAAFVSWCGFAAHGYLVALLVAVCIDSSVLGHQDFCF